MQSVVGEIRAFGAELVAISPQLPEHSAKMAQRHKLEFDVLSDPGNDYARQLGLVFSLPEDLKEVYKGFGLDLPQYNGDDSWELPMPARLIVGQDGTVLDVDADPDYRYRPEPEETVEKLRELTG